MKDDGRRTGFKDMVIAGTIGAIAGGLLVSAAILGILLANGELSNKTETIDGQKVVVNDLDATTQVEAVAQVVPASVVGVKAQVTQQNLIGQSEGTSVGSGFIVTSDGYIVTNEHVVSGSKAISISLDDDTIHDGQMVWSDSNLDLAIIKIDADNLPALTLGDSEAITVGETVIAIGNPMGLEYQRSVTSGIVSALNRSLMVDQNLVAEDLIQTDATINAGNSGGPLCDGNGNVIGINTYKNSEAEGMGFALPINIVKPIVSKVVASGSFTPIVIGVNGYDKQQAAYYNTAVDFDAGIYVNSVEAGSGADKAGIKKGDIITSIDNTTVDSMLQMRAILYGLENGDEVNLSYLRDSVAKETKVKVQSQK